MKKGRLSKTTRDVISVLWGYSEDTKGTKMIAMKYWVTVLLPIGLAFGLADSVLGQAVQLPTFQFTTINTTVSVPDRGGAVMGGISRFSAGSTSRGVPLGGKFPGAGPLFNNRGIGSSAGASSFGVTATVIDHQELDEMVRQEGAARRGTPAADPFAAVDSHAGFLSQHVGRREEIAPPPAAEPPAAPSVEEICRQNELAAQQRSEEALFYFQKGQAAELEGKNSVAKIYYQMASRRATGDLQAEILTRLVAVTPTTSRLANSSR